MILIQNRLRKYMSSSTIAGALEATITKPLKPHQHTTIGLKGHSVYLF